MLKLGHRGAPGYPRRFENTIQSFQRAMRLEADGFELDARRCKNELVVSHDALFDRAANGLQKAMLADFEYQELATMFQAREISPELRIPRLLEVLWIFGNKCIINIEVKECGLTQDILWLVRKLGLQQTVIISCFDKNIEEHSDARAPSWAELKCFSPFIKTALIASREAVKKQRDEYIARAKELGTYAIHPHYSAITPKLMQNAKVARLNVNAWTVNNRYAIRKMRALNVHGIISDFPERL